MKRLISMVMMTVVVLDVLASDPEGAALRLKTEIVRATGAHSEPDSALCRACVATLLADTVATNFVDGAFSDEPRLLAWLVGLDAVVRAKTIDPAIRSSAAEAIVSFGRTLWHSGATLKSVPSELFACQTLCSAQNESAWDKRMHALIEKMRPEDLRIADATPGRQTLFLQVALEELCAHDYRGHATRMYRAELDRLAPTAGTLEKSTVCPELASAYAALGRSVHTNELMTVWGRAVTPANVWRAYPRPQLVRRGVWQSLNGMWDFEQRTVDKPGKAEKILVPFPVESQLSGIRRKVLPTDELVYRRTFEVKNRTGMRTLLNFEAVDFRAQVFVNGIEATDVPHEGGCVPFSLDVTDLVKNGRNDLEVRVWDPTDSFINSTGKQTLKLRTCFFPASSGIIGSVWTEQVPRTYLDDYQLAANPDSGRVTVTPRVKGDELGAEVTVEALWQGKVVATAKKDRAQPMVLLDLPKPFHLWSCDNPALYDLRITVSAAGGTDTVEGYFGVRQLKIARDPKGIARLVLNGKPVYLQGVLDQGYWPDGYLTPPSEEACRWDVDYLKDVGVNCIRKHIKVEPRCFYAECDRKGVMVMQDMPSAWTDEWQQDFARINTRYAFARRELKEIVDHLGNHPSVVCWIPYNEGWSQPEERKTMDVGRWLKRYDPSRLVDLTSGWYHFEDGWAAPWKAFDAKLARPTSEMVTDILDWHEYPGPKIGKANPDRAIICGEFGGMGGGAVAGHGSDIRGKAGRYVAADDPAARERAHKAYRVITEKLLKQIEEGSSGSILCESFDCFWEQGNYVTFDRAVERMDRAVMRECHRKVREAYASVWRHAAPPK